MDRLGEHGVMAARAQAVVRDDPAFADKLVEERKNGVVLWRRVHPEGRPPWEAHYLPWARILLEDPDHSQCRLEVMRYTNRWQTLDFTGTLEACVREIQHDPGGVFFPDGR